MRDTERDLLLVVLSVSAGSADGWSYFGLGHAFVANMTGNTVLIGTAAFLHDRDFLPRAVALLAYALGTALAAFLTRKMRPSDVWTRLVSWTLLLEGILLLGCEADWIHILNQSAGGYTAIGSTHTVLLGCLAFAIGMQSGAMLQLRIPGVVTTYISGTWTRLMNGLVRSTSARLDQRPRQKAALEERLLIQAQILAAYLLSAVLTGWLLRYHPRMVGAVVAISVLFAAIYGLARTLRQSQPSA